MKMLGRIFGFVFLQFLCIYADIKIPLKGRVTGSLSHPVLIPLQNHHNVQYYGDITLGTPPQTFSMLFDSGSTDIIVLVHDNERICNDPQKQDKCKANQFREFDIGASGTCESMEGTFAAKFVDQSERSGFLATDILGFGKDPRRVRVAVGLANRVVDDVGEADGIMGLSFNMGSSMKPNIISPFESIVSQLGIPPEFGFYAERVDDMEQDVLGGELYLGGYNQDKLSSDFLAAVPVEKLTDLYYSWKFLLSGIKVGGQYIPVESTEKLENRKTNRIVAIPDTGSSLIGAPPEVVQLILDALGIPEAIRTKKSFLCADLPDNLATIELVVQGTSLSLGPEDYITIKEKGLACKWMLCPLPNTEEIILGYPFLQKYYTVFDYGKKEMRFARAKQQPKPESRNPAEIGRKELGKYPAEKVGKIREDLKNGYVPKMTYGGASSLEVNQAIGQLQAIMGGKGKFF